MLDKETQKVEYAKYIEELWHLYDLAINDESYLFAFEILGQIRLEVV